MRVFERLNADAAFLVVQMEDPRQHGVIVAEEIEKRVYRVNAAIEKAGEAADQPCDHAHLRLSPGYL